MGEEPIHLLLIEDNPGDARLIEHMLAEANSLAFVLTWVDNLSAGIAWLRNERVDLVLLDLGLPESSGLETLLRLFKHAARVPTLVVLSGLADEDIAFQAVQSGAQDYLIKGQVDSALLVRAIRYALERSQAEEALRQAHAELEHRVVERTAELAHAVDALHEEIAERKRTEVALREREARIRRLVESNIIGVFFWDTDGSIMDANEAFLRMTGRSRADLLSGSLKWNKLTPPEYMAADDYAADELLHSGICTPYEKEYVRKDGSRIPILLGGALLEGSQHSGVAFVLDMSASKQADAERRARQIAEAASRAKSEFLASMSHELRSPLNTMLGFARLMARYPGLPHEAREDLRIVLHSGEHLHALINQVLDLSKIEAGRMQLNEVGFALGRLLDELHDMFSIRCRDTDLRFTIKCGPEVAAYVYADQLKLRQVLINLLNNAFKFTGRGKIKLRVAQRPLPGEIRRLLFTITDTGPGIAPEEMDKLFGTFVQTETGRLTRDGSGLGLAISRSFVRLMGGDIRIESQPGQGTTVSFEIPVRIVDIGALAPAADLGPRQVIGLAPGQPQYRILLADDRREARQLLRRLLQPLGFDLREACSGQEALDIWHAWRPHLIWMDMRMPVMSGREAASRIKAQPNGNDTVIIALTASSFAEERAAIMAAGCDDFLSKPFDEADFFALMHKHLGVRFLYQEEAVSTLPQPEPDVHAVSALPDTLVAPLAGALIRLDTTAVEQSIEQIRLHDTALADGLQVLANEFQYERMLSLLPAASMRSGIQEQT